MFRRLSLTTAMVMLWSLLSLAETPAYATPMSWGDRITVSLKWPKGTLKVYVQPDPKGLSRDTLVKEGIDRWKKAFGDRGITLDVSIGQPSRQCGKADPIHVGSGWRRGSGQEARRRERCDCLGEWRADRRRQRRDAVRHRANAQRTARRDGG